jgi:hypothetical protein
MRRFVLPAAAARKMSWLVMPLCLLVLIGGCRKTRTSAEHADVTGQVIFKGKPLPGGRVTFVAADGFASVGDIDEKGNYTINAPVGAVKISVDNSMLREKRAAAAKGAGRPDAGDATVLKGTFVPLPDKFSSPDKSGLTYTVVSGPQKYNIELPE